MRDSRRHLLLILLATSALAVAAALTGPASGRPVDPSGRQTLRAAVPGELIVGFRTGVSAAGQAEVLSRAGAKRRRRFDRLRGSLVSVDPSKTRQAIRKLESDGRVAYAEPNFVLYADHHGGSPNDPSMHQLWGLDNFGQTVNWVTGTADADIDAQEAWSVSTGSPTVTVAVIDTGVDLSHPDLAATAGSTRARTAPAAGRTAWTTTATATSTTGAGGTS
jgi:thermitase